MKDVIADLDAWRDPPIAHDRSGGRLREAEGRIHDVG
jgi:hypothetical protein